jgi:DNA polymerase-3 subunit alpha
METEPALLDLAYARALPIVATNEVYFASPDDYEAHDALLCIAEGRYVVEDDRRRLSREHFFKTAEQMGTLFADLPEALANTQRDRPALRLPAGGPQADPAALRRSARGTSEAEQLKLETVELRTPGRGRSWRRPGFDACRRRLAAGRLHNGWRSRSDVISKMKFPGYFLIVADFIKWAKANGIPVGPGRGSGAGSVVAWSLTITDLDPLRFGLLFERFLNPSACRCPTSTSISARTAATR